MKKYIKRTRTIITPRNNSEYFDVEKVTYKRELTPFEKNWIKFQKDNSNKKKKQDSGNNTAICLLVLLFILALCVYIYLKVNGLI